MRRACPGHSLYGADCLRSGRPGAKTEDYERETEGMRGRDKECGVRMWGRPKAGMHGEHGRDLRELQPRAAQKVSARGGRRLGCEFLSG